MGYGTALLIFKYENHEAVGIKCPINYSYKKTGYCFIESTSPTIPTYAKAKYVGVGELDSIPEIIKISDGKSFDGIAEGI